MRVEVAIRVVLDTNVILSSISSRSLYRSILDELFEQTYDLYLTNDILLEYEEKLETNFDKEVSESTISAILLLDNVKKIDTYFQLGLIKNDPDDNKFVDCAFAANVHFLVTNDKHFRVLKEVKFPRIKVIDIQTFKRFLSTLR